MPGQLDPTASALLHSAAAAGLSDPLKSYLSAAYSYSAVSGSDVLTASSPLMAGLAIPGVTSPGAEARNVIKAMIVNIGGITNT